LQRIGRRSEIQREELEIFCIELKAYRIVILLGGNGRNCIIIIINYYLCLKNNTDIAKEIGSIFLNNYTRTLLGLMLSPHTNPIGIKENLIFVLGITRVRRKYLKFIFSRRTDVKGQNSDN